MEIKNITAKDLTDILDLFESEEQKQEFIERADQERYTYSVTIADENTIWQNKDGSSNEVFFNVYLSDSDIKELEEVGEPDTMWIKNPWSTEGKEFTLTQIITAIKEYLVGCIDDDGTYDFRGFDGEELIEEYEKRFGENALSNLMFS